MTNQERPVEAGCIEDCPRREPGICSAGYRKFVTQEEIICTVRLADKLNQKYPESVSEGSDEQGLRWPVEGTRGNFPTSIEIALGNIL